MTDVRSAQTRDLLARIERPEEAAADRLAALVALGDMVDFAFELPEEYRHVLERLAAFVTSEHDPELRRRAFYVMEHAFLEAPAAPVLDLEPLERALESSAEADPDFIRHALSLLSLTYRRRYRPVFERFQASLNPEIASRAAECIKRVDELGSDD